MSYVDKQNFISWLQDNNIKKIHPSVCVDCLETVSDYAVKHNISKISFWEISDYKQFNSVRTKLAGNKIFRFFNRNNAKNFDDAGKLYSDYLKERAEAGYVKADTAAGYVKPDNTAVTQEINFADVVKNSYAEESAEAEQKVNSQAAAQNLPPKRCVKHNTFGYGVITRTENGHFVIAFFGDSKPEREIAADFSYMHNVSESEYDAAVKNLQQGGTAEEQPNRPETVTEAQPTVTEEQPSQPEPVTVSETQFQTAEDQPETIQQEERQIFDRDALVEHYKNWLYDVKKLNWRTKESCGLYLNTLDEYLSRRQLITKSLLASDISELTEISETLSSDVPFLELNNAQHSGLGVALKYFIEYVKSGAAQSVREEIAAEDSSIVQTAKLSGGERAQIANFFRNEQKSALFENLFLYQKNTCGGIMLDVRPAIIGAKRDGEKLRFYIGSNSNIHFSHYYVDDVPYDRPFTEDLFSEYCSVVDKNNVYFAEHSSNIKLKQPQPSASRLENRLDKALKETEKTSEAANKPDYLVVDFSAAADYTFANIKSVSYFGNERADVSTWRNAYQFILSGLYEDYPDKFTLILADNYCAGIRIELSENAADMRSALTIAEGLYAEGNNNAESFVKKLAALLDFCEVDYENVAIKYTKTSKKEQTAQPAPAAPPVRQTEKAPEKAPEQAHKQPPAAVQQTLDAINQLPACADYVEKFILNADIDGTDYSEICTQFHLTNAVARASVKRTSRIVEIKGKLYHEDAFCDWQEGADQLYSIMQKLMQRNNGYISSAQLYEYASIDMHMFLNDNGINDERSVYELAQHLFEKNKYKGVKYTFSANKTHISAQNDVIENVYGLICKFADDQGGVFTEEDLADYLTSVGNKAANLRQKMRVYDVPEFFYIEEGKLIYAKYMKITDEWFSRMADALKKLFDDMGDHVILRNINSFWFEKLPALPCGQKWNPLLLQGVLRFYGKRLKAHTIYALWAQDMNTLHAMLVSDSSPVQTFADAVISYFYDNGIEKTEYDAEELRQLLLNSGMIHGGELSCGVIYKALCDDNRFVWNAACDRVTVRVE